MSPGQDSFVVSIPVQLNKYLFIFKTADKPEETNVYWVQLIPDSSCTDYTDYTGVQYWIDFQDWTVYGLRYEHNTITNHLDPVVLADCPNWEQGMIRQGYFSVDETSGKILANDNPSVVMKDIPCPDNINGKGKNFFQRVGDALGDIGDFIDGLGGGGGAGGSGGGSNFLGPTGDYPNPGLGGSGSDYAGGGIIGNTPSNNGTGPGFMGASTDPDMPNQTDENGFLYNNLAVLTIYFQSHPYQAIDCSDLVGFFGDMWQNWQNIGSYIVPTEVNQRITEIRNQFPSRYSPYDFHILKIGDAAGPVVNCDFFALHINELPLDSYGYFHMSPGQFLDFFRQNINTFDNLGNNTDVHYDYYNDQGNGGLNDYTKFYFDYENSLGSLAHFHNPAPLTLQLFYNDGSVIESGFDQSTNHKWFMYTTFKTPLDGQHPVSGNRKFGIYPDNANGGYVLYISGVDRATDLFTAVLNDFQGLPTNNMVFNGGTAFWKSVLAGAKSYINNQGGSATDYTTNNEIVRQVNWAGPVSLYLTNQITFQQLLYIYDCL